MTDPRDQTNDVPEVERLRDELERARREHRQRIAELASGLDELAQDLDRLAASRAWRLGHGASSWLRRVAGRPTATAGAVELARRRVDRLRRATGIAPAGATADPPAARDRADLAQAVRARLGPVPALASPPAVTALVLGGQRAARELYERTDYPALDVTGAEGRPQGDLVLIVGKGVEPLEAGWLAELVSALEDGVAAVGATLLDGAGVVLSAGVRFETREWAPHPLHVDAGRHVLEPAATAAAPVAAVSAAVLVRRPAFERIGGLADGYAAGGVGVDLSLALAAQGERVTCSPRAMVVSTAGPDRAGVEHDRRLLTERWGPQLRREHRLAMLSGDRRWTDAAGPHLAFDGREAADDELAQALERDGWRATDLHVHGAGLPGDLDYLVTAGDGLDERGVEPGVVVVGRATGVSEPSPGDPRVDRLDVLCASSPAAAERLAKATGRPVTPLPPGAQGGAALHDALARFEAALSVCIKIGAPSGRRAERWGDSSFAVALQRELQRRGGRCLIQAREEWDDPAGFGCDVALFLHGRGRYAPRPAQFNVLWCISHPDEVTGHGCDAYDLVAVASPSFAAELRERTQTPVVVLEQATDPRVFFPEPPAGGAAAHQIVFVGNTRGVRRRVVDDVLPTDLSLGVYGDGWQGLIDSRHLVADHVPNDELRRIYSSGAIVLNDHWDDMREHGFISNRLYDAVACGAFVITDPVEGVAERFGGAVVTYRSRDELRTLVSQFAVRPRERAERGAAGRSLVLGGHTFADRVDRLLSAVGDGIAARGHGLRVTP